MRKPGVPDCDFQLTRALDVLHYGGVAMTPKLPMPTRLADASGIPGLVNGKVPDKRVLINPTSETPTVQPTPSKTSVKPKPKAKARKPAGDRPMTRPRLEAEARPLRRRC